MLKTYKLFKGRLLVLLLIKMQCAADQQINFNKALAINLRGCQDLTNPPTEPAIFEFGREVPAGLCSFVQFDT